MLDLIAAVALVSVTALGARQIGRRVLGGRVLFAEPVLCGVVETAIGLALVSWSIFLLISLGVVSTTTLLAVVVVVALAAALQVSAWLRPYGTRSVSGLPSWLLGAVGLWCGWVAFVAALPPTGIDELIYHLEVPRQILAAGGMPRFTDNIYAYFPQGADQLFVLGLGLIGEPAARLFHALFGLLTGLAIFGAARPLAGERAAAIGTLAWLTAPTVLVVASWAYVDLFFALYAFLALLAVVRIIERRAADEVALPEALLAGALAGCAWTAKYTGMQLTLLLLLLLLVDHLAAKRRRPPVEVLPVGALALLLVMPYLLRSYWLTGWPMFPFLAVPLPLQEGINWDPDRARLFVAWLSRFGGDVERTILERVAAPVAAHVSGRFGDLTAFDGRAGLVFLLAPLALWRDRELAVRLLGGFWLLFALYWSVTTTQVRFLLPALPAAAVLLAVAVARWGRWLAAVAAILVTVATGLGVREGLSTAPGRWWRGVETSQEYLERNVAGAGLYRIANERLRSGERLYLINMRHFGYLLDLPGDRGEGPFPPGWRADYVFQQYSLGEALTAADSARQVRDFFTSQGITHIMIDQSITLSPGALDASQRRLLVEFLRDDAELFAADPRAAEMTLWRIRAESR